MIHIFVTYQLLSCCLPATFPLQFLRRFPVLFSLQPLQTAAFRLPAGHRSLVKVTGTKSGKKVTKSLSATITVKKPATRIKINGKTVKKPVVTVGSKTALTAVSAPKDSKITFKSSDETVATVSADGTLTALKAGTVNIEII